MVEDIFLSRTLGLKILLGAILHEVALSDVDAGSIVMILPVPVLVLFSRGYNKFRLKFLAHCEVPGLVRRKEKEGCRLRRTGRLGRRETTTQYPSRKHERGQRAQRHGTYVAEGLGRFARRSQVRTTRTMPCAQTVQW